MEKGVYVAKDTTDKARRRICIRPAVSLWPALPCANSLDLPGAVITPVYR